MSTSITRTGKPRVGTTKATAKTKRTIYSAAAQRLRKHIVYHDPDQWKADIETGKGDY